MFLLIANYFSNYFLSRCALKCANAKRSSFWTKLHLSPIKPKKNTEKPQKNAAFCTKQFCCTKLYEIVRNCTNAVRTVRKMKIRTTHQLSLSTLRFTSSFTIAFCIFFFFESFALRNFSASAFKRAVSVFCWA